MTQQNEWVKLERDAQLEEGGWYQVCKLHKNGSIENTIGISRKRDNITALVCSGYFEWRCGMPFRENTEIWICKIEKKDPPVILNLTEREKLVLDVINQYSEAHTPAWSVVCEIKSILTGGAE